MVLPDDVDARIAKIRNRVIETSFRSKSAHVGSSLSALEIFDAIMCSSEITSVNIDDVDRARFVVSKGHAAMAYYATLEAWDLIPKSHLDNYLLDGTQLWGHITRSYDLPAIDVSTGSLGHGLSLSVGYALAYKLRGWNSRIYCVLSDGECDEGSVWEAAMFAAHHRLANIAVVVDYNKIQSLDRVANVIDLEPFADKWKSFNWTVKRVDGHNSSEIEAALKEPFTDRPLVILADTIKGKGISRVEDTVESHYHPAKSGDFVVSDHA